MPLSRLLYTRISMQQPDGQLLLHREHELASGDSAYLNDDAELRYREKQQQFNLQTSADMKYFRNLYNKIWEET